MARGDTKCMNLREFILTQFPEDSREYYLSNYDWNKHMNEEVIFIPYAFHPDNWVQRILIEFLDDLVYIYEIPLLNGFNE